MTVDSAASDAPQTGSRYGQPKALVSVDGVGLAETALATLRGAGLAPIVAVIGAAAPQVRVTVPFGDATVVENSLWHKAMGSSLQAGLAALEESTARAVVVLLVDTAAATASAHATEGTHPSSDVTASAEYRSHLAGVLTRRALAAALAG